MGTFQSHGNGQHEHVHASGNTHPNPNPTPSDGTGDASLSDFDEARIRRGQRSHPQAMTPLPVLEEDFRKSWTRYASAASLHRRRTGGVHIFALPLQGRLDIGA
ncbi:MAG: hypothetical protein M1826_004156 [Phylliscum demangeonii]|nr:MAG: hypothetical protein M1826_004156 [Phylliscum demangeonii]